MAVDQERIHTFDIEANSPLHKILKSVKGTLTQQRVLALDPGETTGHAQWSPQVTDDIELNGVVIPGTKTTGITHGRIAIWQRTTKDIGQSYETLLSDLEGINHLRAEDYKIYGWKADDHKWGGLHTPQWIGAIKVAAHVSETPISFCMAQQAKVFWTDDKLKMCGLYEPGLKHARDALRHLLYYLCWPTKGD